MGDNADLMSFDESAVRLHGPTPYRDLFGTAYAGMESEADYVLAVDIHTGNKIFMKLDLGLNYVSQVDTTNFSELWLENNSGIGSRDGSVMYVADLGGSTLDIVVIDPRVGTEIHRFSTGTTPLFLTTIALSQDGQKVHTVTQRPPDYESRIAETNVNTGATTFMSWTLADVEAQVAAYHPTDTGSYTLVDVQGLAELPGGDFLLCGIQGTFARVRRSDGHIVKFYDAAPWVYDPSRPTGPRPETYHGGTVYWRNELDPFCMVLSADSRSFWVGGYAQPEPLGIALHPSGIYPFDGKPYGVNDSQSLFGIGWLVKFNVATGATESFTNFFESPFQMWLAHPPVVPPVLTLGQPSARIVS